MINNPVNKEVQNQIVENNINFLWEFLAFLLLVSQI